MPAVPFDDFMKQVESAPMEAFRGTPHALEPGAAGKVEFEAMRTHILSLYRGLKVAHTFVMADGQHVDCVPIEQQPTLGLAALQGHAVQAAPPAMSSPPPPAPGSVGANHPSTLIEPQLAKGKLDLFGNEMSCPVGTIPMRRVTLEEMMGFKTANDFFQKSPGGGRHPGQMRERSAAPDVHSGHRYGTAAQAVPNSGGSSFLNVWNPTPVANGFALSQHWYTGGSFGDNSLQTVEGGWQVYPGKYKSGGPHLFIYWTANAYTTTGCYNLDCKAFVQVNNSWVLGGALAPVSTTSGTQYQINMQWKRDTATGNWWLYLGGSGALTAVGYYPKALFGTGALSKGATEIEYGGEVYGMPTTGQMGSGAQAAQGWQKAAYQKEIWYIKPTGPTAWASLGGYESDPTCYTEDVHNQAGGPGWDTYFFFGGQKCG